MNNLARCRVPKAMLDVNHLHFDLVAKRLKFPEGWVIVAVRPMDELLKYTVLAAGFPEPYDGVIPEFFLSFDTRGDHEFLWCRTRPGQSPQVIQSNAPTVEQRAFCDLLNMVPKLCFAELAQLREAVNVAIYDRERA